MSILKMLRMAAMAMIAFVAGGEGLRVAGKRLVSRVNSGHLRVVICFALGISACVLVIASMSAIAMWTQGILPGRSAWLAATVYGLRQAPFLYGLVGGRYVLSLRHGVDQGIAATVIEVGTINDTDEQQ